ncbi:MAG: outer membrane protein assembly factor BamD [Candidatus Polarisedimenticolaceae bacterium]|nr:outer membrane protein assembly factor BamD [Candidatus Polarisedimenticolaceae bacterium]
MSKPRLIALLLLLTLLSGCALLPDQIDLTKDWSASKLYLEAKESQSNGDYVSALDYLQKLEARFPFGRYAMQAQLDTAYIHYRDNEPDSAIAAADRFIKLHPMSEFAAYAYYLKGIVNFNRNSGFLDDVFPTDPSQRDPGATLTAFNDFGALVRRFPNSKYAADARKRMIYLRNNMAKHELHAADYYMRRGAYLAAANRASKVVKNYQRSSSVKRALEIMIEAYNELGLTLLSADTQQVLELNLGTGRFVSDELPESEWSFGRKIWNWFGLDKS